MGKFVLTKRPTLEYTLNFISDDKKFVLAFDNFSIYFKDVPIIEEKYYQKAIANEFLAVVDFNQYMANELEHNGVPHDAEMASIINFDSKCTIKTWIWWEIYYE